MRGSFYDIHISWWKACYDIYLHFFEKNYLMLHIHIYTHTILAFSWYIFTCLYIKAFSWFTYTFCKEFLIHIYILQGISMIPIYIFVCQVFFMLPIHIFWKTISCHISTFNIYTHFARHFATYSTYIHALFEWYFLLLPILYIHTCTLWKTFSHHLNAKLSTWCSPNQVLVKGELYKHVLISMHFYIQDSKS